MDLDPILYLSKDEKKAASLLGQIEARYLVDTYYQMQKNRITSDNRVRAAEDNEEPNLTLQWFSNNSRLLEDQIKQALKRYSESTPYGQWALSQKGIGPVISAGFLSRLEMRETVGSWWRYCGLDPTVKWEKGKIRPWNAHLKRLCYLTGESFIKVQNRDDAFYGKLYKERKELESKRNEELYYKELAEQALNSRKFTSVETKKTYEQGKLPEGRIHLRASRYAVKIFLAHLHDIWYRYELGKEPPLPYPIAHLNHTHMILPPT